MSEYARSLVWLGAFLLGVAATLTAVGFGYYFLQTDADASVGWGFGVGAIPLGGLTSFLWWKASRPTAQAARALSYVLAMQWSAWTARRLSR